MHAAPASGLPLLLLLWKDGEAATPAVRTEPLGVWHQEKAIARLDPMVSFRIKERSRKRKATLTQFYLAAYHVLLARVSSNDETSITVGIADTAPHDGRPRSQPWGYSRTCCRCASARSARRRRRRSWSTWSRRRTGCATVFGMRGFRVGFCLTGWGWRCPGWERGGQAPLFQAVFDYKQGQAESGSIGGASMTEVVAARERTPYDVVLEMSDDPTREPLITVNLQGEVWG